MSTVSVEEPLAAIAERLGADAGVRTVFGDPVEAGDRTVIPVARVAYGFGGGWGERNADAASDGTGDDENGGDGEDYEDSGGEREGDGTAPGDGAGQSRGGGGRPTSHGGGGGGGVVARPVGALEVSPSGTRFVRVADRRRPTLAALAGVALGYLLGRRGGD